jgi:hypothetical protein
MLTEADRNLANVEVARRAAKLWYKNQDRVIKFECFNQEEAEWFERFMKACYPEVKFFTSHLVFKDRIPDVPTPTP